MYIGVLERSKIPSDYKKLHFGTQITGKIREFHGNFVSLHSDVIYIWLR